MPTATRTNRALLPVVLLSLALVVAAVPALNVALPNLARGTKATQTQIQWIVDAYALVFAGLLLPAGATGDRYGRKPVLLTGLLTFAAGSLAASFAGDPTTLIVLRGVMGVGAALVMPTTLSVITTSFGKQEQSKAITAWVGVASAGAVLGLLVSGILLEWFDWPAVFVLNAVMGSVAAAGVAAIVPNSRDPHRPPIDYLGAVLSSAGLAGIVFGAIEGPDHGWSSGLTLGSFVLGAVLLALWVAWGLRVKQPLLDPRLFCLRGFSAGVLSISMQFFVFLGFVFVYLQYAQLVLGYSPLQAALSLLPMGMLLGGLSRRAPHLVARIGRRAVATGGLLLMAVGAAVLSQLSTSSSYWAVLAGILPFGAGMALATPPATTAIVGALPAHKQGVASAVNDAAREVGGTLGIAVLGSVLNFAYRESLSNGSISGVPVGLLPIARRSLAAAMATGSHPGTPGIALQRAASQAFTDGLSTAFAIASGVLVCAAVVVFVLLRPGWVPESDGGKQALVDEYAVVAAGEEAVQDRP